MLYKHDVRVVLQSASQQEIDTCSMHPEIMQESPRSCPKCGMALEPLHGGDEEDTYGVKAITPVLADNAQWIL